MRAEHWRTRWQRRLVEARQQHHITASEYVVLDVLVSYANYRTGAGARPGVETLMARTGLSRPTVRRALRRGRDLGLIEQTRRGHHNWDGVASASEYRFPDDVVGSLNGSAGNPCVTSLNGSAGYRGVSPLNGSLNGSAVSPHRYVIDEAVAGSGSSTPAAAVQVVGVWAAAASPRQFQSVVDAHVREEDVMEGHWHTPGWQQEAWR